MDSKILERVVTEIKKLKTHPAGSDDYHGGYQDGRNDALCIVEEALDSLPTDQSDEALLSPDEQREQAKRCNCRGADDYCGCQNTPDAETRRLRSIAKAEPK